LEIAERSPYCPQTGKTYNSFPESPRSQRLSRPAAEQAALENAPLLDLEKRMMSFTELDECPDPVAVEALSP
jgi:hypothetical protein